MPTAAVITGDIVNSTLLTPARGKEIIQQVQKIMKDCRHEFYRGDSFQAFIKNPTDALTLLLRLRAVARSFGSMHDVRASIGIGEVGLPVNNLRTATSEAFVLSGRAFEKLKDNHKMLIESANADANISFRIISYFGDFLCQKLTTKQAEVLNELLQKETQTAIAKKLHKAQATINKHAQAALWPDFEKLIQEYHITITQFQFQ